MSVFTPQTAEKVVLMSIDYEAFPNVLQEMERSCEEESEKLGVHLAESWTLMGGDVDKLMAILQDQSKNAT